MFTQLRIQNFKSWADTGEFRMAPLTGFFGTNSSGKTAILQFLLMLKQTVESSDRNRILHLGGDQYSYVDLGTTYDISHRHRLPEKIKFEFEWLPKYINQPHLVMPLRKELNKSSFIYGHYGKQLLKFDSEIYIEIDKVIINYFGYSFKVDEFGWNNITVMNDKNTNISQEESTYQVLENGNLFEFLKESANFAESKVIPVNQNIESSQILKNFGITGDGLGIFDYPGNSIWLLSLAPACADLFRHTYYLAPLREYPKRTYLWSGERPKDVGRYGELTVAALLAARKKDPEVEISVAKALYELGLIYNFRLNRITPNRGDYEILVQKSPDSAEVLITDVGFGVSQVLPILVLCYYAPKGATLIFEQPEIHLHPSVQAGLADIFIEVIKTRNIQIIIESHSEHLLRRLQRRMAEEKDGFTNDDAALYFCKMNDQGDSELVTLDIDDYGNICNYPEGFFGDEMGDLVAMTEAAINRQMNVGA
jgi:AAA15 family ATPase/GTPase